MAARHPARLDLLIRHTALKRALERVITIRKSGSLASPPGRSGYLESAGPNFRQLSQLGQLHGQIINMGEIPAYQGAERFFERLAQQLVQEDNLPEVLHLCEIAKQVQFLDTDYCQLVNLLAKGTLDGALPRDALSYGLLGDWLPHCGSCVRPQWTTRAVLVG